VLFKLMQDWIAGITPQYWQFWIGLMLVLIVLAGRERMARWARAFASAAGSLFGSARSARRV
jgi:branched-chain amino acid transport system permease protein